MNLRNIKEKGKCCRCKKPLQGSTLNMIRVPYKANWGYPTMGNILTGMKGAAVAFLCDQCVSDNPGAVIPLAVEFRGEDIIYHDVTTLEKI